MKPPIQAISFQFLFQSLSAITPSNTEHKQARAFEIGQTARRIAAQFKRSQTGWLPKGARWTLPPKLENPTVSNVVFTIWWGDFTDWYWGLTPSHYRALNETLVCIQD